MSKKKKNKFKKSKHGGQHSSHHGPSVISAAPPVVNPLEIIEPQAEVDTQIEKTEETVETPVVEDNRYEYVRKDVRKLILSILGLFALMTIIYFLNQQFHFLQSLGDWIYKIANFQI